MRMNTTRRSARSAWVVSTMLALTTPGCGDDESGADDEAADGAATAGEDDGATGGSADGTTDGEPPPAVGCEDTPLRENPADFAAPGPWPVGVRSVTIEGLGLDVWYPAVPGSEADADTIEYDIREFLPESEADKIPDEDNTLLACDCYRDLPIDDQFGPYPVIFFIHGTAGFRSQSIAQVEHWASRGFVVLAAEHPGLMLADLLSTVCGGEAPAAAPDRDVEDLLDALRDGAEPVADLLPSMDLARIGVSGHSAGGAATGRLGDVASVLVPMAAGGSMGGDVVESTLVLAGDADTVVDYPGTVSGYEGTTESKRLVGLAAAGHLAFSNLCELRNDDGQTIVDVGIEYEVCGVNFAGALFQCTDDLLTEAEAHPLVNAASAAAFEETLHCRDIGDAFAQLGQDPNVAELREEL